MQNLVLFCLCFSEFVGRGGMLLACLSMLENAWPGQAQVWALRKFREKRVGLSLKGLTVQLGPKDTQTLLSASRAGMNHLPSCRENQSAAFSAKLSPGQISAIPRLDRITSVSSYWSEQLQAQSCDNMRGNFTRAWTSEGVFRWCHWGNSLLRRKTVNWYLNGSSILFSCFYSASRFGCFHYNYLSCK